MRHRIFPPTKHIVLYAALALCTACRQSEDYRHFETVDDEGWDITDRYTFAVPPVQREGNYDLTLHLRTTTATPYPFLDLYVEVVETWCNDTVTTTYTDTVACPLARQDTPSTGVVIQQYTYPIRTRHCQRGDSLTLTLRHIMRREMLPGITDVGIMLQSQ